MGKRNRERRAAKAKQRARARSQHGGRHAGGWSPRCDDELAEATLAAVVHAQHRRDTEHVQPYLRALLGCSRSAVVRAASGQLRRALPLLWDNGWQPAEVVREARRSSRRAGRLVASAVLADHADRSRRAMHDRWVAQVDAIAASAPDALAAAASGTWLAEAVEREVLDNDDLALALVEAVVAVTGVGRLPTILAPPGTAMADVVSGGTGQADDPVLAKVRALLAKAESTTFEAEAAALTAKAQELMARHAIDVAKVWDERGRDERPTTVRLPIDDPYVDAKSLLLHVVASHSRCRSVIHDRYAMCSVIGFASDVAATEVLFTSLLVQSQVAMQAEATAAGPGSRVRSRSFRSSFLVAYANRIGERLQEVNAHVESAAAAGADGGSLLPVLAARSGAVDEAVDELFGDLRVAPIRGGDDAVGWARGRAAADRAKLARDLEASSHSV